MEKNIEIYDAMLESELCERSRSTESLGLWSWDKATSNVAIDCQNLFVEIHIEIHGTWKIQQAKFTASLGH